MRSLQMPYQYLRTFLKYSSPFQHIWRGLCCYFGAVITTELFEYLKCPGYGVGIWLIWYDLVTFDPCMS